MGEEREGGATRREAVAGGLAAGLMTGLAALAPAARAAEGRTVAGRTVTGIVYEDRSGSGRRGPGDPGLPGVLVSNGREVATTDAEGRYSLPLGEGADEDGVVFVIKPAGFALPLDGDNLPRFAYVHQPGGTPGALGLRYRGLAPTGPLPASVDFGLRRAPEPDRFDVVLMTDPQPESHAELDFVRDAVLTGLVGTDAAFGMTTGDIMFDDLALYPRYNRMIGRLGVPWFHIGGNHDLDFEAPDARHSRDTFKRVYGAPSHAFAYGQAVFLMLDNVRYLGRSTAPAGGRGGRYEGRIGERGLAFVANVLAQVPRDRLIVLATHIPLLTDLDPNDPAQNTVDRDALLALLAGRPVLSVSGHTHTTEHHYFDPAEGTDPVANGRHHHHVLTAASGSWWSGPYDRGGTAVADSRDGTPNGHHVLSVDGATYTTRFVPSATGEPAGRQMRLALESQFHGDAREVGRDYRLRQLLGSPIAADAVGATDLVVNLFDGGPRSQVTARLGDLAFPLARTRRSDPFVAGVYDRNAGTKKPWVKAEPSTHVFVARLPAGLPAGAHRLDVEARDEYGRPHRDHLILEITTA